MKYPYRVIKDGKLYLAGEEVPDDNVTNTITTTEPVVEETETETVSDTIVEEKAIDPVPETLKAEFKPEPKYGKNQINRMPISDLRNVAIELKIDNIQNKTGAELKREIIEILGL